MSEIVRFDKVTKRFGKVVAVNSVDLSIEGGEIHSVVGENGAGKTTLMRLLYGMYRVDSGMMGVDGREVKFSSPKEAIDLGIGMVHQNFMLIDSFTVYENVVLGMEPKKFTSFDRRGAAESVGRMAERYGIEIDVEETVGDLSVGLQQKVEILKLLYRNARILIFDEPTAVLTPQESDALFDTIRQFKESGKTVIFISHKLREVKAISDRISVMRGGRMLGTFKSEEMSETEIAEMVAGRKLAKLETVTSEPGDLLLGVRALNVTGDNGVSKVKDLSMEVRRGEIVGIAGVVGNGQSEFEEALAGMRKPSGGTVNFKGIDVTALSVDERRDLGMGYIPEDRIRTGLAAIATIWENILMGHQNESRFSGPLDFVKRGKVKDFSESAVEEYNVVCKSIEEQTGTLSGGNMQKVVIAREFTRDVDLLTISQPTRGVDVGGIEFIHKKILEMKGSDRAVILISADLDEILSLSDRILVMYDGRIVHSTDRKNADPKEIGLAMLGGK